MTEPLAKSNSGPQPTGAAGRISGTASPATFIAALGYPLQLVCLQPETGAVKVFHASDDAALAAGLKGVRELNLDGWNVYYEVNSGAAGRRSKGCDIHDLRAVVGDADAKEGRTVRQCVEAASRLPLPPSFVLVTGGGVQVVYLLAKVAPVSPETVGVYEAVGRAVREVLDGDAVFDLPRIMRLPGFTNWPNAKKRAAGRQPAKAQVLAAFGRRYSLDELAEAFRVGGAASWRAEGVAAINSDLMGGMATKHWFDRLSPKDKDACLAEMLRVPAVVALADTSDAAPSPNWRTVLAAAARSGAPNAYHLARAWAQTSPRFDAATFGTRFRSYLNA